MEDISIPLTDAIFYYNQANTDSELIREYHEIVMMFSAFQRLLRCNSSKEHEIVDRFLYSFIPEKDFNTSNSNRKKNSKYTADSMTIKVSTEKFINDCLSFSIRRLKDLENLNNGDIAGADRELREQLVREFFFHLVGAIDFLSQLINTKKNLQIPPIRVKVYSVVEGLKILDLNDPIIPILSLLHPDTSNSAPLPRDPYSEEGSHYRIIIYRNFITHRSYNPIKVKMPGRSVHLIIYPHHPSYLSDPRDPYNNNSEETILDELKYFHKLVQEKCKNIINML